MILTVVHFLGFQACWFATILSATDGSPWRGPICIGIFALLHITFISPRRLEVIRLLAAAAFGFVADTLLISAGILQFGVGHETLPPAWMVTLWVLFMTTLPVTMPWLRKRYLIGALVGAIAGPVCYFAGAKLGALDIGSSELWSTSLISLEWLIATPVLIYLTERTNSWIEDKDQVQNSIVSEGVSS
ncbi:MAG: hypothetical protein ACI97A_001243 [Planctomycetota bacterium]|jgi:hypothetical protein